MLKLAILLLFCCIIFISLSAADNEDESKKMKEKWKKKHVTDYSDADIEKLYDQWEDNDPEELEEDELPEWKRPPPKIDLSKLDPKNPEAIISQSKKGRTLMMFVTVSGNPTEKETGEITQLWQSSLFNLHIEVQRYIVGANRALFVLSDGSKAYEIKNFLIEQARCELVTIENKDYPGKGASQKSEESKDSGKTTGKKRVEL